MKKHSARDFFAGILLMTLIFGLASPAGAALVGKTIQVFTGVEIYVDGVEMKPTDANGNPVETFVYNGTTYVPLRAVSQSLGYAVSWDGAISTSSGCCYVIRHLKRPRPRKSNEATKRRKEAARCSHSPNPND